MNKRYVLLYRKVPAFTTNVRSKAQSVAWQLAKDKGWDVKEIEIRDNLIKSMEVV